MRERERGGERGREKERGGEGERKRERKRELGIEKGHIIVHFKVTKKESKIKRGTKHTCTLYIIN